ncbi:MAG: tRNA (adenine(57)-N(1)/adenine(58)-N(1))-methyltransferase TrmI [Candidatus Micrarchaeota archaeon]|nr:MAG: tRNA (adenine(57)-N(1)/adenine(58)-N(1))-methyltransferase TrmI [Candidatus Micrarchaeota archaeon]
MKYYLPEFYRRLKRGPQVILPKDIGIILTYTDLNKDSICLDIGTGSGWLALTLARFCKHVDSFDINEEHLEIAKRNASRLDIKNIDFYLKDLTKERLDNRQIYDLATFDIPSAADALLNIKDSLKDNAYLAFYMPNIDQIKELYIKIKDMIKDQICLEIIDREILLREKGVRPVNYGIMHTGYILIARLSTPPC